MVNKNNTNTINLNNNSENNKLLYPEIGDKEFGYKIYHKKEFNQFKIPKPKIDNLNEAMIKKCSVRKMSETQKLLKRSRGTIQKHIDKGLSLKIKHKLFHKKEVDSKVSNCRF